MVEFEDGSVKAQLGTPDMRLPIQYALYYPKRPYLTGDRLDFREISKISIGEVDRETFKGLDLAYLALHIGGSMPTVLNAANEKAVSLFLDENIEFLQIYDIIEECMKAHNTISNPSLGDILKTEEWVYNKIEEML